MSDINEKTPRERLEEFVSDWEESKCDRDTIVNTSGTRNCKVFECELRVSDIRAVLDMVKDLEEIDLETSVCPVCNGRGWNWFNGSREEMAQSEDCGFCYGQGTISVIR